MPNKHRCIYCGRIVPYRPDRKYQCCVICFKKADPADKLIIALPTAILILVFVAWLAPGWAFAGQKISVPPLAKENAYYAYTDQNCILAIIGEGENQGPDGMLALAHAIRNRGYLKGVYGINAPRVKKRLYSLPTYKMAAKAWRLSLNGPDLTYGASGWGNAKDIQIFKKHKWWKKCKITVTIKEHIFYRKV